MLYLKSVTLDKFKSFKHAELLLSKGFTCVVGPNGSGKSVIFDALAASLGEPSPNALRVSSLGQLINNTAKPKAGDYAKAHIKLEFDGEQGPIIVTKVIRSDSKTLYKLNGKTMSRREVIEFFSKNNVRVDGTTTIAQGQIDGLSKMNSKQRRELIDTAAGIKEFEMKKAEALRELEKVDQKISETNAVLHERIGFLKEIEKQKEAAENYTKMVQRSKLLRYSILVSRQNEQKGAFESTSKEIAVLESKRNELAKKKSDIAARRDQLNSEASQLQAEFAKMSSTSGETRAKLDMFNSELTKLEVEIPALTKEMDEINAFIAQSSAELKESTEKVKANTALISDLDKSVSRLDSEISKMGVIPDSIDISAEIEALDSGISSDQNRVLDIQGYIQQLQADMSIKNSRKLEIERSAAELKAKKKSIENSKAEKERLISDAKKRMQEGLSRISKVDAELTKASKAKVDADRSIMDLQQQKYYAQQTKEGNMATKLSEKFSEKDGFYGKAGSLCSYDGQYAYAVETSAANRLEYFVVDSIKAATAMIDYLKKSGAGRATFIPIDDLNSDKETKKDKDLKPLIDTVKFDQKFSKVFNYIFSNTYIIDDPNEAKKFGVGKHRYVTLQGELIEQSGVISGGTQKNRLSLAAIESRLKAANEESDKLYSLIKETSDALSDCKKDQAVLDAQLKAYSSELSLILSDLSDMDKVLSSDVMEMESLEKDLSKMSKEVNLKDKEKLEAITTLESKKNSRKELHDKFLEVTKGSANTKKLKAEKEKLDSLRQESEGYKIKKAQLKTEIDLLGQKCESLSKSVQTKQKQLKESKESHKEKAIKKDVLQKSKAEIEKEINSKNDTSKKAYSRIQLINSDIQKLSSDYGQVDAELGATERQTNEIRLRKGTSETRLADITAELKAYDLTAQALKDNLTTMETEVNVLAARIVELGNVNLQAPQTYEERKRDVEEATSRITTLQTEKDAVLRMMDEMDSKKLQTFMDMLNDVNKNFIKLYNYIFPGRASIVLEDEKDPLNSGIHIKINNGKHELQYMSMSGGERAIISLMLLFSIHMGKKSSLYIFDEVDAALDKENAKKLSTLIKEMSREAQFIVISHNDSLIVNSDAAIGVVKTDGESKAYGIDVPSIIKK